MNEQCTQVRISSFCDATQAAFITAGMLSGYQAQPCCELPSVMKCASVRNGCCHRSCGHWTYTLNGANSLAERIREKHLLQLRSRLVMRSSSAQSSSYIEAKSSF